MKNNKNIELQKNAIKLPKIGWVKARGSDNRSFEKIKRVTITRTPGGYYKASVLVESENQALDKTNQKVGLDMGQMDLMIGSDGYPLLRGWITSSYNVVPRNHRIYSVCSSYSNLKHL